MDQVTKAEATDHIKKLASSLHKVHHLMQA